MVLYCIVLTLALIGLGAYVWDQTLRFQKSFRVLKHRQKELSLMILDANGKIAVLNSQILTQSKEVIANMERLAARTETIEANLKIQPAQKTTGMPFSRVRAMVEEYEREKGGVN
jgi:hypothetical protein